MKKNQFGKIVILIITLILINTSLISISAKNNLKPIIDNDNVENSYDIDILKLKIRMLMIIGYIPSVAACIIENKEIVWSQGYGYYDFDGLKQPTEDTIYLVASVSKTITATSILQLYEQGLFDLDDDVNNYLPFPLRNPNYPDVPITFRMLLSHHSSLHDHDEAAAYEYFFSGYPLSYLEELLVPGGEAYCPELWGDYPPGGGGNYSNIGFNILGYLIELLSQQRFEEYCQQNIFIPLKMNSTSFEIDNLPVENLACSYYRFGRLYLKLPHVDYTTLDPCGGLFTTINDLSHFLIAHMNNGTYQNISILNETTIKEMHRIQYPDSTPYYGILSFGLGWLNFKEEFGKKTHGHDGDLTYSHARMRIFNENKTAIIYLFNKGYRPSILPRTIPNFIENQSDRFIRKNLYYAS